ncbi:hypothetical protein FB566_1633 [Stackebrandtia endophytica]|uniref:Uncharacterized protein n=1 Tax=Stackebrandtia endophytica TaxID=1496996 RepID=A0A543AU57_9ACTN|nr:hypothetical protein [Stackebrandtia endophytica]TQL76113.1 hypothetical protein FB566_1633 [Stackebrandtia endophytica]
MALSMTGGSREQAVVSRLEQLALNRTGAQWRSRVGQGLRALREWLSAEDGSERQLGREAPRMTYLADRLLRQRHRLTQRLDRLLDVVTDVESAQLERSLWQLIREARLYRRGMSELMYQAYEVDIGGEH